ncbi:hypothetical protein HK098_002199 [Nowakowskiella sp. JEL0407]|nr:hypothetical protein HK098_002199 [Nowakowskiella sp. JEL0407]
MEGVKKALSSVSNKLPSFSPSTRPQPTHQPNTLNSVPSFDSLSSNSSQSHLFPPSTLSPTQQQPNAKIKILYCVKLDKSRLYPTKQQQKILLIIGIYFVAILVLWNIRVFDVLYPLKLITVSFHEFGHALATWITGGRVISIEVDPNQGGLTTFSGGSPFLITSSGYLGSSLFGALLLISGFSQKLFTYTLFLLILALITTLFFSKTVFTFLLSLTFAILLLTLFFIKSGAFRPYLQYFVLFMGVMSSCYSVWDVVEDTIVNRINGSDADRMAKLTCGFSAGCSTLWGLVWCVLSLLFAAVAIFLGIYYFKGDGVEEEARRERTGFVELV